LTKVIKLSLECSSLNIYLAVNRSMNGEKEVHGKNSPDLKSFYEALESKIILLALIIVTRNIS